MASQQATGEQPLSKTKSEVIREAQRIESELRRLAKGHLAAARFWEKFHLWIGIPMVLLSSVAGAAALSKYDPEHLVSGVLSIAVAALSGVVTFPNPNEKVLAHQTSRASYESLVSTVRIFWAIDCWGDEADVVLTENLKRFSEMNNELNKSSSTVPKWAMEENEKQDDVS